MTRDFLMQGTEVSQRQWTELSGGRNPSCFQTPELSLCTATNSNPDAPVESVDWYSALAFANELSAREGLERCYRLNGCEAPDDGWHDGSHAGCLSASYIGSECNGYRLPTEAEWELAARGRTREATYAGDLTDIDCEDSKLPTIAWYCGNSRARTQPVAGLAPNAFGLFDMLGNVDEWVWDAYATYTPAASDPEGPPTGAFRVVRGGNVDSFARHVRAAHRDYEDPANRRSRRGGFRLARTSPLAD
jgi:formylglycine-generating enzyme required for sulfatase activity